MPKSVAEAARMERATARPITELYSTPVVAGKSKPGDLLAHESFGDYALPAGVKAVRIIYHSLDADGRDVAASGVVLIPAVLLRRVGGRSSRERTAPAASRSACRAGTAVSFRSYPGLDHDPTMFKSVPDQLAWIRDRFAGKPAGRSCAVH